jgi:hypothetical protein
MGAIERLKRAIEFQVRLNDFMLGKVDGFEGKLAKLIEDELITVLKDLGSVPSADLARPSRKA